MRRKIDNYLQPGTEFSIQFVDTITLEPYMLVTDGKSMLLMGMSDALRGRILNKKLHTSQTEMCITEEEFMHSVVEIFSHNENNRIKEIKITSKNTNKRKIRIV